jgi:hypothetical protein
MTRCAACAGTVVCAFAGQTSMEAVASAAKLAVVNQLVITFRNLELLVISFI